MEDFKSEFTFEERKYQSSMAMKKYSGRIPVYVYKHKKSKQTKCDLPKHKFLVPNDITVGQFVYIIRKNLRLESDQGIFIFVNNILPATSMLMSQLYSEHRDEDGFLYLAFSYESVFG
jgi:GABA(A) receptor-associated protein